MMGAQHIDPRHAREALHAIDPSCPRDEWHEIGRAAIAAGLSVDDIISWSEPAPNYSGERDTRAAFRTVTPNGKTGPGTLWAKAIAAGWKPPQGERKANGHTPNGARQTHQRPDAGRRMASAAEVWQRCEPATVDHPYITAKQGLPEGLRVVPQGDPLRIAGASVAGWLAVPVLALAGGDPVSLQFVPPPGEGKKLNLPGASMAGVFIVGELVHGGTAYLCEGIGQAWACWKAAGHAALCCFGWGRVRTVAAELRQRDASARLVLVPDAGKESDADRIAAELVASVARMPEGSPKNFDANDYAQAEGFDALEVLLSQASKPAKPGIDSPLSVVFADDLAGAFEPTDELVEGLLTTAGGSVFYGDSNSGKTFAVIDIGAAVARGVPWLGRHTEPGLVVYLAAESPASVRSRLQAYQRHHGLKVPNFAIVQSPIDLFDGDADTDAVISLVQQIERLREEKARLIIGDTLARLSAGANENAGQDMGLVVRRFDRIRSECSAHFLLVHHSGKVAANGARGWSGIRAAVDSELEVTDSPAGRCIEVTKQRDLSTKGERIGFRLEPVHLGYTKWGKPATSCVVVPTDAPAKTAGKRPSEVAGAILEALRAKGTGIKKRELVQHFEGQYDKSAVYRELKRLVETGQVHECVGIVALAGGAKGAN